MRTNGRTNEDGFTDNDFETIFEQSPVSTQIFAPNGDTLRVNRAWERLWGAKSEFVVGTYNVLKDRQLVETGTMPYIKRGFKGEVVDIPAIKYVPSKTVKGVNTVAYRWTSGLIYPIKDSKGKIVKVVLQHEDITERKIAEDGLRESEARFKAVWESAAEALALSDENGIVLAANPAYFKLYGYAEKDVIGKRFDIIFPKAVRAWAFDAYLKTFATKKSGAPVEADIQSRDGERKVVESRYTFLRLGDKDVMLSVVRDISSQIAAQRELEGSEERLRLAVMAGKIGAWDWDVRSGSINWSDRVYEFHGLEKREFDGSFEKFRKLLHPDDREGVLRAIDATLKERKPFQIEFRTIRKDGSVRWLSTSGIATYDAKGKPVRMFGATIDMTERKTLENQKDEFIGIASHELKTPVTSIKVYTDLLERQFRAKGDEGTASVLSRVNAHVDKLTTLIKDLLDVTKIEGGKMRYDKKGFDLCALIREVADELQQTSKDRKITVTGKCAVEPYGDRERIGQVVTNLVSNAIKYSPAQSEVRIAVSAGKREAKVAVIDSGIGISKDKLGRIFERFYRATGSKKDTYPGLGLGLYISSEIIRHHGGRIWAESEEGKGSTFFFTLPLAPASSRGRIARGD